ncbi:hypothetical protein AB0H43_10525 [Hamadaea sp. NPDC050747]|uniref:hypothetical protein n=1 Tax=Hamadaea sp. NPDC050747 TaxID=3155789 RepID=UPI0033D6849D
MTDPDHLYHSADLVCFGGTHPVWSVGPNGELWPWLIDLAHEHHEGDVCCHMATPAHEQLGRLPREIRARLNPCQAMTRAGDACTQAARPGQPFCHIHASRTERR